MAPPSEPQQNGAAVTPQLQDTVAKGQDDNREYNCVTSVTVQLYTGQGLVWDCDSMITFIKNMVSRYNDYSVMYCFEMYFFSFALSTIYFSEQDMEYFKHSVNLIIVLKWSNKW